MIGDQAATLREMKKKETYHQQQSMPAAGPSRRRDNRAISITSGKGGVGKTNIAANLAYLLTAKHRKNTLVLDADTGLANIDVLTGIHPLYNLHHVLRGEKTLQETIVMGPGGIQILPSSSGDLEMIELSRGQKLTLMDELKTMNGMLDYMLVDTGAGISSNVMYFNVAVEEIIVVTTPEPTALTDAYALIKVLYSEHKKKRFRLLVNMARDANEARQIYTTLSRATDNFLNLTIEYLGHIVLDDKIREAVRQQKLFAEIYPQCPAARCLAKISEKLSSETLHEHENGGIKFFWEGIIGQNQG